MEENYWYLKNCSLFGKLTPAEIAQIEQVSRSCRFSRRNLIYVPTDAAESVLLLASGRVRIYHLTPDGKQALTAFIEAGEMFGELALFAGGEREEFAEAMENSLVILIPRPEMESLMERRPEFSLSMTKLIGLRRKRVERRLKSLLFRSNRDRLIHLLLELAERYGQGTADGILLGLRLSHQEMAGVIGATRETVTVLLGELQYERLITIKQRRIYLKQLEALAHSIDVPTPTIPDLPRLPSPNILGTST